eukprot:TRINITY_DN2285_c0_g5_i1.p2 TRINITY_DN2285_c0_g5~~TRINITY_DN2285_c0_g5_i1.p2  ORF type:complete len:154 (+),score=49.05 TRINITY_DN2285_c0_g5_i1:67-528(+)
MEDKTSLSQWDNKPAAEQKQLAIAELIKNLNNNNSSSSDAKNINNKPGFERNTNAAGKFKAPASAPKKTYATVGSGRKNFTFPSPAEITPEKKKPSQLTAAAPLSSAVKVKAPAKAAASQPPPLPPKDPVKTFRNTFLHSLFPPSTKLASFHN